MAPLPNKQFAMTPKSSAFLILGFCLITSWASVAQAQRVRTGDDGVCCAFIPTNTGDFSFACNQPSKVPGSIAFPVGTIVRNIILVPGKIAQCVGRFPLPAPSPFFYGNGVQLTSTPNGLQCAGQFDAFFQGLRRNGGFLVQCTN